MLLEHDRKMLNDNLEALLRNNTWYCPTHMTRKSDAYADDPNFRARYDSINPILRFLSFEDLDATIQEDTTKLGREIYKSFYQKGLEITKTASDMGVKILAGSDVPELSGSSLIDELHELSKAGLTNVEVLRSATLYPSEYYGLENEYGTIEEHKFADLVILSENPLQNLSTLERIEGVIYIGQYIDLENIKLIQKDVYSRNVGIVMSFKLLWDILMFMTI